LIYVSAPYQVLEVNPNTFALTAAGSIQVNAFPGKLLFTPDGLNAIAANQRPTTGSAAVVIALPSHVVTIVPVQPVTFDQLMVLNSTTFLAYSSLNQILSQINLGSNGSPTVTLYTIPGVGTSSALAAALSPEVPAGGRSAPRYLYTATNVILYKSDLTNNTATQFPLSAATGVLSIAGPATTGTPATLLQYGNNQTISASAVSLPIVLRVLDNNGNPLSGITVTFAASSGGASVSPLSATTGTSGYAVTYATAPPTSATFTVTATAGSQNATYTMTVGSGGGGPTAGGISIVAGQGQIVLENNNTSNPGFGSPLIVQVNDANGKPVVGASVTFAITQGLGAVGALGGQPGSTPGSIVLSTDNNGQASVGFQSGTVGINGNNFTQTTITATAPGVNTVTFYETTTPQGFQAQVASTFSAGDTFTGQAGTTLTGKVGIVVTSVSGIPIPNVSIRVTTPSGQTLDPNQPGAQCADPTGTGVLTGPNGAANCDMVLNGHVGTTALAVNAGYSRTTASFTLQITPGPPGLVTIRSGNNQTGSPGQRLPLALAVQVTDSSSNILPGVPVTWAVVTPGTVTLSNVSATTDSTGAASALATLGNIAGPVKVTVTAGSITSTFTLTVTIPTAGIQKVSGDPQTTLINSGFPAPLVVLVLDGNQKPVQGATVTFQVASGSASVGAASTTTGANGQASTTVTAGSTAGSIVITAATAGFSVQFNLTARLPGPSNVTFANAAFPATIQQNVSPGEIVVISGVGIATGVQGLVTAYNIIGEPQLSLAGISVTFNGVSAPIYWVMTAAGQPDQMAVQVPFEAQSSSSSVVINSAGGGSGTFAVQVTPYAPGIFETTIGSQKFAVAVRSDGSYVSPSNPAHPGETIRIYVTGLGQVAPAASTGSAGVPGQAVTAPTLAIGLNNGGVPYLAAEYAQGMVGVYVITIQVPSDTQTGPAQPVGVIAYDAAGNSYFAQGSVIPIQ
jgi:adhesin/invasin